VAIPQARAKGNKEIAKMLADQNSDLTQAPNEK
jgi:hypothetical protein